jgi:hypothetical protein
MTLKPEIITGLPAGVKEAGQRVDFRPTQYDLAIKTKGYRAWWSRAAPCPCANNAQTRQPDPRCTICDGYGELLFLPEVGLESYETDAHGNPIEISDDGLSVCIDVLMSGLTKDSQIFERFGAWTFGMSKCSTQAGNELGWRDRLELRDAYMHWAQGIDADGGTVIRVGRSLEHLRYRALSVNLLRSRTTVYRQPGDFTVNSDGQIVWASAAVAPAEGTVLAVHYKIRPVYRIIDWPHAIRDTKVAFKSAAAGTEHRRMPTQCTAKLDFLLESDDD